MSQPPDDEWAPITEADLFAEPASPAVRPAGSLPIKEHETRRPKWTNDDGFRPYPQDQWAYFNRLLREDFTTSIDFAATAAGLSIYDALVALQQRDPYFYEIAVLRGPQGGYVPPDLRKQPHYVVKATYGSDLHERAYRAEAERTRADDEGKPSVEECRARFLTELGGRSQHERVDGLVDQQVKYNLTSESNVEERQEKIRECMRGHWKKRRRRNRNG